MGEIAIKIKIADKDYSLRVEESDQDKIREAAALLNDRIKNLKESFGLADKQDVLSMIAFDLMVEKLSSEKIEHSTNPAVANRLKQMDELLSSTLSE